MKIKTAEEMIDLGPYNNWYDEKSDARVMDTNDVVSLMKEYAAQFIDLAAKESRECLNEDRASNYMMDKMNNRILKIKKQIK